MVAVMSRKCPHCDATCTDSDIEEDDTGQKVCSQCGAVLEGAGFHSDNWEGGHNFQPLVSDHQPGSSLPQAFLDGVRSVHRNPPVPEGKTAGITKIKHLLQFMGNQGSKQMLSDCVSMYTNMFNDKHFHHCMIWKKEILAGCCVYIVCREQNIPVTITHLSMLVGCPPKSFWSLLRKLQKVHGITPKGLDLDEAIDSQCTSLGMEDNIRILVKKLLPIVKDSWITEGRSLDAAIKAVCCVAWQSLNVSERASMKYQAFARKRKMKENVKSAAMIHQEILEMVLTLARAIPWLTSEISYKLALYHLEDILQYQRTIFQNLTQSKGKASQDEELQNLAQPKGKAADDEELQNLAQSKRKASQAELQNLAQSKRKALQAELQNLAQSKRKASQNEEIPAMENCCDPPGTASELHAIREENVDDVTMFNTSLEEEVARKTAMKKIRYSEKQLTRGNILRITSSIQSKKPANGDIGPFLPYSFLHSTKCESSPPKASTYSVLSEEQLNNLDSEEVTEVDLDSKDMWRYIKTSEEIEVSQRLQNLQDIRNKMTMCSKKEYTGHQ